MARARAKYEITAQDKTKLAIAQAERNFGQLKGAVTAAATAMAGFGAAAFAATQKAIAMADAIAKSARVSSLATDEFQTLRIVAGEAGVAFGTFDQSMIALIKRTGELKNGTGALNTFLKKYDETLLVNIKNSTSQREVLGLLADAMAKESDQANRAALASAAFSRAGVKMELALRGGDEAIRDVQTELKELGTVISRDTLTQAEALGDAFGRLKLQVDKEFVETFVALGPAFYELAAGALAAAGAVKKFALSLKDAELSQEQVNLFGKFVSHAEKLIPISGIGAGISTLSGLFGTDEEIAAKTRAMESLANATGLIERPGGESITDEFIAQDKEVGASRIATAKEVNAEYYRLNDENLAKSLAVIQEIATAEQEAMGERLKLNDENMGAALEAQEEIKQAELVALSESMAAHNERAATAIAALQSMEEETKDTSRAATELGFTFQSAFEDAIIEGESFRDVLHGIWQDIGRIAIRKAITEPAGTAIGGFFGGLFAGNALGGPVTKGVPSVVGERGPELFVPGQSGAIVPNHRMGGGGVVQNITISAPNSDASVIPQIESAASRGARAGYEMVVNDLIRGGPVRQLVG